VVTDRFDGWLQTGGPVALVIREYLEPVNGKGAVFFPPTFAPPTEKAKTETPSYIIDNGVCLVDSVGSQGNRLEPLFKSAPYAQLVPQVTVTVGDKKCVNLLDAGHRAADALVRYSGLWTQLQNAFLAYRDRGDATPLAKIAPTTLVFGAWDSRETQAKIPRLVESTVRAFGVEPLTRGSVYMPAVGKEDLESTDLGEFLSSTGLAHAPSRAPGGVTANEIRRDAVLNLIALLALGTAPDQVLLRRYILALALIAFLAPVELYLRSGCLLTASSDHAAEKNVVFRDGHREPLTLTQSDVVEFARAAANDFGVGTNIATAFDSNAVKKAAEESRRKGKK